MKQKASGWYLANPMHNTRSGDPSKPSPCQQPEHHCSNQSCLIISAC